MTRRCKTALTLLPAALLLWLVLATLLAQRPLPDDLQLREVAAAPLLLDREGRVLRRVYDGGWNLHERVALEQVPLLLQAAFIAAEDRRFADHHGIDWRARLAALAANLRSGRVQRGASTISEQVVRILQPRPRTLWSRWVEGFTALRLEARFSKTQILEFYLNQVPYGAQRRGIVPAARYYFDRSLDTLSAPEMLALAVLVRAPSRLANDPPALQRRVRALAAQLPAAIAPERAALDAPLPLVRARPVLSAVHFAAFAMREHCAQAPGTARHSSLDARLQADAEAFLRERLHEFAREGVRHGAVLIVDLDGNRILAYASADQQQPEVIGIDPLQAPRQPGSTLKPLLYALAFERGWTPQTRIVDEPLRERVGSGLHEYRNYSRVHYGELTVAEALGNSLNIPAVKALRFVGQQAFLDRLHALGIASLREPAAHYGDGLALGNGALSLFELVQAYTALARGGVWQPLSACAQAAPRVAPRRVLAAGVAQDVGRVLADPAARRLEFGEHSVLRFAQATAVKTGTSSDYRDAWTLAYNARYLVGVWFGDLSGAATSGVSGVRGPALLARSLLARLPADAALRALPAASAPALPSAEVLPMQPSFVQPVDGLKLARDPRIDDALEALEFQLVWREPVQRVRWWLDGRLLAETAEPRYLWPLQAGVHRLRAEVSSVSGLTQQSRELHFEVR